MKPLLLVGGGGHCKACVDVIESTKNFDIKGVVEASTSSGVLLGYSVIGSDDDLPLLLKTSRLALVTVGQTKSPAIRIRLFNLLRDLGAELATVVSSKAYFSKYSSIGEGSIVMHGAVVNAGVRVGRNCIVNSQALLEHDVKVDDHCHISTGALLNGNVTVGRGSFIGSGAIIREGVRLGDNVIVGAGQVVLGDVSDGTVLRNER